MIQDVLIKIAQFNNNASCGTTDALKRSESYPLNDPYYGSTEVSILTKPQLDSLFKEVQGYQDIEYRAVMDNCHAKAHSIAAKLHQKGIQVAKVFVEGKIKYMGLPWDFHVAPIVAVQEGGVKHLYVIDPVLFDRAVPLEEWETVLKKESTGPLKRSFAPAYTYRPASRSSNNSVGWNAEDLEDANKRNYNDKCMFKTFNNPDEEEFKKFFLTGRCD